LARVLGLRLLALEVTAVLTPADVTMRSSGQRRTAARPPGASSPRRSAVAGRGLAGRGAEPRRGREAPREGAPEVASDHVPVLARITVSCGHPPSCGSAGGAGRTRPLVCCRPRDNPCHRQAVQLPGAAGARRGAAAPGRAAAAARAPSRRSLTFHTGAVCTPQWLGPRPGRSAPTESGGRCAGKAPTRPHPPPQRSPLARSSGRS
jgi:hypothetical protein